MKSFYIKHKINLGDTVNLSDTDSEILLAHKSIIEGETVLLESVSGLFLGKICYIGNGTIEVEITSKSDDLYISHTPSADKLKTVLIQSISNDSKFTYVLEKATELGVDMIIPIESKYSLLSQNKALKKVGLWKKVILDATEQSRTKNPPYLNPPIKISSLPKALEELLSSNFEDSEKLCLATEAINTKYLSDMGSLEKEKVFLIAIGPEKGWHSSDIKLFEKLNFDFIKLKGNILRTETAGLVILSIIKYIKSAI